MTERQQEPTTRAFPVAGASAAGAHPAADDATAPSWATERVVFRRPDALAGVLLVLAGITAGASLLLRWLADDDANGLEWVGRAFGELGDLVGTGLWQPLVIVLGGAMLLVLGLLMFAPARTHRLLGLLALLVSAGVTAAVLVPLVAAGWDLGSFRPGFWCAIAVAVLGLLGALKALVAGPRYGTEPPTG
ncbi:hypothetical protein [Blastococcus saxobsidens]|uniref:Uncharacterized protein n=1 Tax=Blastococcus saxobsidens TaxID=138336 RepID=A0A4Q7Y9S5_9ACTN|nr:hypothetical protein [Blastococcus saxobsidens]RZU33123.1 hypothetical protein BKA19_2839 [Blastococcus saxobsidens]